MAKTKPIPALTHTQILCYAIRCLESDLDRHRDKVSGLPDPEQAMQRLCGREIEHLQILKSLYKLETGADY